MDRLPKPTSVSPEKSTDELWLGLKAGDKHAFEQLYRKHVKSLFQLGISIIGDADFVQDCIQELFIDLWKYRENVKPTDNVKLYLYRSLSNKINKERKKDSRVNERLRQAIAFYPDRLESVESQLIHVQREEFLQKKLANCLKKLPVRQNEVLQYLFFENLSYEDTAKVMGINLRSVYTLAWKALSALKKGILLIFISLLAG